MAAPYICLVKEVMATGPAATMLVVLRFKSWPEVPMAPCSMQFMRYAVPEPVRVVAVAINVCPTARTVIPAFNPIDWKLARVELPTA
jgi:hypothetical protein